MFFEGARAQRCADCSSKMRPALAPIEAWTAQHTRLVAAADAQARDGDPEFLEQRNARIRDYSSILGHCNVPTGH
jgi:hypothetical protein